MSPTEAYYTAVEARIRRLLGSVAGQLSEQDRASVAEFLDHNEFELALEELIGGVKENGRRIDRAQLDETVALIETMGLPEWVMTEAVALLFEG